MPCSHSEPLILIDEETVTCLMCGKLWLSDPEHVSSGEVRSRVVEKEKLIPESETIEEFFSKEDGAIYLNWRFPDRIADNKWKKIRTYHKYIPFRYLDPSVRSAEG